ncbi:MAG TPA: methyltransferase domain-containing protein [Bacteroidota bacterium]|nr:methyltransferase domain-containing protein [Bacteroidota bacterium]
MPVSEMLVQSNAQEKAGFAEVCNICGSFSLFSSKHGNYREAQCALCGATKRISDVAKAIRVTFAHQSDDGTSLRSLLDELRPLKIYEAQASGPLHDLLAGLPGYVCGEYLDGVPPGTKRQGVLCEDLTRLSFADNTFDLVVTQDVLEHVASYEQAFLEIRRVLKPGGKHIFTVPLHPSYPTRPRVRSNADGSLFYLQPPVHHGDPLRSQGALVTVDFGADLPDLLQELGYSTTLMESGVWYGPSEITWIHTAEEYERYRSTVQERGMLEYFRYNSFVFVTEKSALAFTGERFVPELKGQIAHEHFHRYAVAREFVAGKSVLDIASGEGYGSYFLAAKAASVTGVDIAGETVRHAGIRYGHQSNLRFMQGSCDAIPCPDRTFDVVVSFETIEHIADQEGFLREVKRVLKEDGVFLVSTPNREVYAKGSPANNPFHVREVSLDEFQSKLKVQFPSVSLFGQRLALGSHVWPLEAGEHVDWRSYIKEGREIRISTDAPFEPEYFLAVCSSSEPELLTGASVFGDKNDDLTNDYHARGIWGASLEKELRQHQAELMQLKKAAPAQRPTRASMRQLAKTHLHNHRWPQAVEVLQGLIAEDPNDTGALLDLASICLRQREVESGFTLVNHVLSLNPASQEAMDLLRRLSIRETSRRNTEIEFTPKRCSSLDEYHKHLFSAGAQPRSDEEWKVLLQRTEEGFGVEGHCYVCDDDVVFRVQSARHDEQGFPVAVNWRETVVCPQCGLTNRMRAAMHLVESMLHPTLGSAIYIAEQTTPFYRLLSGKYRNVTGSEFINPSLAPGTMDRQGVRHEDFTNLSFSGDSLDCVLSFDVFEHIPDYAKAFKESFRVLKPGGALFFSVPFERTAPTTMIRAVVRADGSIEHLQPPEYHGDPIHPGGGCLCYQVFGWDVLRVLEEIGFVSAEAVLYESDEFGYLGGEQVMFLATKPGPATTAVRTATPSISMSPIPVWDIDKDFQHAMASVPFTLVDKQRCFMLYQFALQSLRLEGHVAEVGVYKGGTAKLIASLLHGSQKMLHLFDTFDGMPETDPDRDLHHKGDFADTSLEGVQRVVGTGEGVRYYPGFFPGTAGPIEPYRFCFVHIDVDIYRSVLDSCDFFYPRMVKGGVMVFDDYGFESCPGAKQAVDQFFSDKDERPWYLPTGQCVVIKL